MVSVNVAPKTYNLTESSAKSWKIFWRKLLHFYLNKRKVSGANWRKWDGKMIDRIYPSLYVCRFQNAVLRCPTARLHCFLSSHWPSFKFLSFMAFLITFIQFFFGLPHALFCFGIHFNAILGNLPSAILWTWPTM